MNKISSNNGNFGSARLGFFAHLGMAVLVALVTTCLVTGVIHVSSQLLKTVLTLVSIGVLGYLIFNVADCWRSWRAGTTTVNAPTAPAAQTTAPAAQTTASAAQTTAPATPAPTSAAPTTAPATPASTPAAPAAKKITRAYLQQQAALVDDRMVEAEEFYEAAEKLLDEYMDDKSDYEQKLAKAKARRLPPQQQQP